ncbi:VOC family protein [Devosia naphthalenivorans]|uniref:VOC family protein n=1 Tax=Devosia naphthalenivorans TaxID=2082392 RepID=UPI000D3364C7|nr:VOC family protein [Devosia naphthalenivorans]
MIDHVGLRSKQFDVLVAFYQAALGPLGYKIMMQFEGVVGLGSEQPDLWISEAGDSPCGQIHLAFVAGDRAAVDGAYAAAVANGATDNGAPGLRPHYTPTYYAAFVIDPDGNNLEYVCHNG